MVVTKSKLKSAIYKLFYDTIVDNYGNTHETRFLVYPSFPIDKLSDRTAYPLIVISSPHFSESEFTMRETGYECEVTLMIFDTSKKDLDDMVETIVNIIEDRTDTVFTANGVEDLMVDSDDSEPFDHGSDRNSNAVQGHVETITWKMTVYLDRINI